MKQFCRDILVFLIFIIVINGMLFKFASNHYYDGYATLPNKGFHKFIFSDSHGLPIAKYSEKYGVFNFSAGSDSYFDIIRKIRFLLDNDYKIEKIYLTVDDHTLSSYREVRNNLDRSAMFASSSEFSNYYEYLKTKYVYYYLPISQPKVNSLLRSYLSAKLKKPSSKGEISFMDKMWLDLTESERVYRANKRLRTQFPDGNKSLKLQETLLEIISICQTNNIELIGIKFPLTKHYLEVLDGLNQGADELFVVKNKQIVDLRNVFVDNPEYFENQDHLNDIGGRVFTDKLLGQ